MNTKFAFLAMLLAPYLRIAMSHSSSLGAQHKFMVGHHGQALSGSENKISVFNRSQDNYR